MQPDSKWAELLRGGEFANGSIDVYAANFANLFPLVEATRRVNSEFPLFRLDEYDWSWSYSGRRSQKRTDYRLPFHSSAEYQIFFATESEFQELEDFGIDFIPVPITAYNPAYVFCSAADDQIARDVVRVLGEEMRAKGVTKPFLQAQDAQLVTGGTFPCAQCRTFVTGADLEYSKPVPIRPLWISDAPDQARTIAEWFNNILSDCGHFSLSEQNPEPVLWNTRKLQDVLKEVSKQTENSESNPATTVKFFVWGGPMSSRAKYDVRWCRNQSERVECNKRLAENTELQLRPNTRGHDRSTFAVQLPNLASWKGNPNRIKQFHITYCCIGFPQRPEARKSFERVLPKYNLGSQSRSAEQWLKRDAALRTDLKLRLLTYFVKEVFEVAFRDPNGTQDCEFINDCWLLYDKFCRSKNPIAQLNSKLNFIDCLKEHHDPSILMA